MNDKPQLPDDDMDTPILGMPPLPCCTNCDGSGMVRAYETNAWMTCQFCHGTGIAPFAIAPGGGGGGGGDDKRVLVPTLEVTATHLRDGYVLSYIEVPTETLLKLVPELGEKRRALWKLGGISPEFYVSFRVAIYDAEAHDESSMFVEIDECGGSA